MVFFRRKWDVFEQWMYQIHAELFYRNLIESGIPEDIAQRVYVICWDRLRITGSNRNKLSANNWQKFHPVEMQVMNLAYSETNNDFWLSPDSSREVAKDSNYTNKYSYEFDMIPSRRPELQEYDAWLIEQGQKMASERCAARNYLRAVTEAKRAYLGA